MGRPRRSAAPPFPPMTPFVFRRTSSMCARSASAIVAGETATWGADDPAAGNAARRSSERGASSSPPRVRMTARSMHVLELADVAGPGVRGAAPASRPRDRLDLPRQLALRRANSSEVAHQQRDVRRRARAAAAPGSGRRSGGSRGPRGSVPAATSVAQVAVRRGDDAHVDLLRLRARRRARTRCSWRTRSSFACSSSGRSPTSSRKSVPPSASSKRPTCCADRAGERALLVAEELALEQRRRDRGAVHA